MQDVGCVHGFETSDGLVEKVLAVIVGEFLGSDHSVATVRLVLEFLTDPSPSAPGCQLATSFKTHLYKIHLVEVLDRRRLNDVKNGDDVLMSGVSPSHPSAYLKCRSSLISLNVR